MDGFGIGNDILDGIFEFLQSFPWPSSLSDRPYTYFFDSLPIIAAISVPNYIAFLCSVDLDLPW
ncbi:hypothetical protein B2J93_4153 [Marssonina coronariae]|uniref:Uncharacterized protein n=1 Tax=Diplocarpon coronariae TaxID=2795749 RepID=A0A218YU19_9HELO|nr:hypothetical protein B2J93_4153 [Marssonina coronariae]